MLPLALLLSLSAAPDKLAPPTKPAAARLKTTAELSGFTETGRYAEVERLCAAYAEAYPTRVRCSRFGTTPEGRPMLALIASEDGLFTPEAARRAGRPALLVQGGIHAGEIDGKDAGFWALNEILAQRTPGSVLARVVLVFVPVFNADGHERFGPNHRPNQRGPKAMGFRTTAHNLNLNRDFTKADAPETVAMLSLLGAWDPVLYMDLHVTDGAKFRHGIAVLVDPAEVGPEPLRAHGAELSRHFQKALARHLPLPFYPAFRDDDDPSSGFETGVPPPRFALGYWSVRNRLSVLVETHSWKEYKPRVEMTKDAVLALLDLAGQRAAAWRQAADQADREVSRLGGTDVPLFWKASARSRPLDFLGYAYRREPSAISGALWTVYDERKPEVWKVPLFDQLEPTRTFRAPKVGYLVPPAQSWIMPRLEQHGVAFRRLEADKIGAAVFVHHSSEWSFAAESFEGLTALTIKQGGWGEERRDVPAGAFLVPIDQPAARLILHLLEPEARDSYAAWGFFNAYFEKKEYLEAYVVEEAARKMLAEDPALAREFADRLAKDPEFARSPAKRLEMFERRHPAWDRRRGEYPIWKLDLPL